MSIKLKELLKLLLAVIFKPLKIIKSPDIIAYNTDFLENLYVIELLIIGVFLSISRLPHFELLELIFNPISYALTTEIIVGFYYFTFRWFGTNIKVEYQSLRKLFLPVIMVMYFWLILFIGLENLINIPKAY